MERKEGNVLFNDAFNTFYLWLYGVRLMVKDHSDSERGNLLPPYRIRFPISIKSSFTCTTHRQDKHIHVVIDTKKMQHISRENGIEDTFYLTMHSTHFIHGYMASDVW